jgi:hypothetical protein
MKKVKKDLVSKAAKIKKTKVEDKKAPKVNDLAPKAKNLTQNLKDESEGMKKNKRKPGEKAKRQISPYLNKKK